MGLFDLANCGLGSSITLCNCSSRFRLSSHAAVHDYIRTPESSLEGKSLTRCSKKVSERLCNMIIWEMRGWKGAYEIYRGAPCQQFDDRRLGLVNGATKLVSDGRNLPLEHYAYDLVVPGVERRWGKVRFKRRTMMHSSPLLHAYLTSNKVTCRLESQMKCFALQYERRDYV